MKRLALSVTVSVCCLMIMPGCGRIIDWAKDSYYEGKPLSVDTSLAQRHMRSAIVYDQLDTVGVFDALFLSDEVRSVYVDMHILKHGKSEEQKAAMLRRQLEENNHFINFYVLASKKTPLDTKQSDWSLFLATSDGTTLTPIEIKEVELAPEMLTIFGSRFNRFKTPYLVKFNAKKVDDSLVISPEIQWFELCFRSTEKEVDLAWSFNSNHQIIPQKVYGRGSVVVRQ